MSSRVRPDPYLAAIGRPNIALGICPNELESRAVRPACATAAGVPAPAAPLSAAPSQEMSRVAATEDPVPRSSVVALTEKALFLLTLVAKHDGVSPQAVLTRLIAERAAAIGLSPLLGEHFDSVLTPSGAARLAPDGASAQADDGQSASRPAAETILMRHSNIRSGGP